ncbi:MAG: DNA polymerase III, partial [Treponema sp.]|nr:DNA polymerase III [Treponema sp.]
ENAERMREDARNALLKLLEEPPETLRIVMTAQRRESVMPTILSRLRPYRFSARSAGEEAEILRRVFRDPRYSTDAPTEGEGGGGASGAAGLVASYLDSFTPQPAEKLLPLAAFFVAAVTRAGLSRARGAGAREVSPALNALGSYCARIAENSGLERADEAGRTLAVLSSATSGFEGRAFPRFLSLCLNLVSEALAHCESPAEGIRHREMWKKRVESAQAAHSGLNQRPDLALESLFHRLSEDVARGGP